MSDMQKQFEEWFFSSSINPNFEQACWECWQASRAALVVELPVSFPLNDDRDSAEVAYLLDVLEKLALAGVRYK